ncbi:adenylosuccinate synthetase [Tateyamaria sp. SN3-11]|uniref:adenylosuccinate synthetase n=1 Tax=Tateyamaria sp. SN3-11 TaxID=3092147 RepID=UPI0039E81FB2
MFFIVVGSQYGGEGKGKISAALAASIGPSIVCRSGGINSSHTVVDSRGTYRFRMLPTSVSVGGRELIYFGAGSLIHLPTLEKEVEDWRIEKKRILIDSRAGIVSDEIIERQREDLRYQAIGSTLTGTGYATADRALRQLTLAGSIDSIDFPIGDVSSALRKAHCNGVDILVEGHQGYGLSNYHGDYPYCSSRDCTSSAILSEIGVGPVRDLEVILAVKTFETRNHPGFLSDEIDLSLMDRLGIREFGGGFSTISNNRRRAGHLNIDLIKRAVWANGASGIAITCLDYLFEDCAGASDWDALKPDAKRYVKWIESHTNIPVKMVSTGRESGCTIIRKSTEHGRSSTSSKV